MRRTWQNQHIHTSWTEWRRTTSQQRSNQMRWRPVSEASHRSLTLRPASNARPRKRDCRAKPSSTNLWKTLRRNRRTDKRESWSYKSALETRRSQCREESSVNAATRKSQRQLPMRTRTPQSWRWERTCTFRSCGMLSCARRWRKRWDSHKLLMRHSSQSRLPLV